MTAIEGLLRKAGELNDAGLKEICPALVEIAAIQASLSEALSPFYLALAGTSDMEPLRYDFVIPAGIPEIKADTEEPSHDPGRAEVSLGPINVHAVVKEIQKAIEGIGQESANIPAAYTTYIAPAALQAARAQPIERQPGAAITEPVALPRPIENPPPIAPGQHGSHDIAHAQAQAGKHGHAPAAPAGEWVEKSIRRSTTVMSDLTEVRRHILDRTINIDDINTISPEASSIGTMARYENSNTIEGPANHSNEPLTRPTMPDKKPDPAIVSSPARKVTEVQPIMPRPKAVPPAEEAAYNARGLSEALMRSAESIRPLTFQSTGGDKHEPAAKVEWPQAPAQAVRGPAVAGTPSALVREPSMAAIGSAPAAGIARSFGAMGEYMKAVTAIGMGSGVAAGNGAAYQVMDAGRALFDAMSGSPTLREPMIAPFDNAPSPTIEVPSLASSNKGQPARAGMGMAANIAAVQPGRGQGISMIHRLIMSAPLMAGSAAPQAPSVYGSRDGLSWTPPTSPLAASGGENIVNVMVPPAGPGNMGDHSTTNKVSSFHNTFNITVNVKGGEDRDLKELGKKIGMILSDEIKRYGGMS